MLIDWKYRYVPEGQLEPDKHGRWAVEGYIFVKVEEALPEYSWFKEMYSGEKSGHMPVKVVMISKEENSASRFCASTISFSGAGNIGMSNNYYICGDTLEEVQKKVQVEFDRVEKVFKNCL